MHKDYDGKWPKLSLVTPSFNQGSFLEETILSVLKQGYPNLEYIVVDGGSSDNSIEIIHKYEKSLSVWVSEKDDGQADAINKGFALATGELLCWLNSDDVLYPNSLFEIASQFIKDPHLDLVYGDVDFGVSTSEIERKICGRPFDFLRMFRQLEVPIPQQGSVWRRSAFDRVGGLASQWQVVLDRDFFIRLADQGKLLYVPATLGLFRNHRDSKSSALKSRWIEELPALYQSYFNSGILAQDINSVKSETMGVVFLTCGSLSLQQRKFKAAFRYILDAFVVDPFFPFRKFIRRKILHSLLYYFNRDAK